MGDFVYFPPSPRCTVCGSTNNVQEYEGSHYCNTHLNQRLEREMDSWTDSVVDRSENHEHEQRLNSIGLDT